MQSITRILKRMSRLIQIIISINWIQFWKLYDKKSEALLWIPSRSPKYFGSDAFIWDMATISGFINEQLKFRIVIGNGIGKYFDKKIFFSINNLYNIYRFADYTNILLHITSQLEQQGNAVFPNYTETILWENKAYMHQQFYLANVHEPATQILSSFNDIFTAKIEYPFLIKEEHSFSYEGLHKVSNFEDLVDVVCNENFQRKNKKIIVQELITRRKNLRVILVQGEIVLFYWQITNGNESLSTATSADTNVDFDFFPELWRGHIINTFQSLGIVTGAFDIIWQDDDLTTEPIYLAVSPFYQPNPKMDSENRAYAFYKQHFQLFHSWDAKYVDIIFKIKQKQVKAYLSISV